jgi:transposase
MTHISGFERSQLLLLPEAVDDYVVADNPVRFIDAFVDELDLSPAGFGRVAAKATGRPSYAPADLLKLYIYGYLNRVRSSRRLEMESHRNIEVIWLLRSLKPDFKTIADFRRDNRAAFRSVFREFVLSPVDRRRVSRLENEAVLDRMAAQLKARPEILDRRREIVEHPFGSIKQWMNQGAFLMKGLMPPVARTRTAKPIVSVSKT